MRRRLIIASLFLLSLTGAAMSEMAIIQSPGPLTATVEAQGDHVLLVVTSKDGKLRVELPLLKAEALVIGQDLTSKATEK